MFLWLMVKIPAKVTMTTSRKNEEVMLWRGELKKSWQKCGIRDLWTSTTRKRCKLRRYTFASPSLAWNSNSCSQTVVSLDLYLAYLRAAFHTCYYCAVVTDHLEELQRKCLKHVRKPLSKMLLEEVKAAEAEKAEKEKE